ncbi:MAG: hypothetical protein LBI87_14260 [Candidatus Accumulibacter sp.]|jgi:hypothetical protein|nr:hypothetical protein [Accumulibacter sp.]
MPFQEPEPPNSLRHTFSATLVLDNEAWLAALCAGGFSGDECHLLRMTFAFHITIWDWSNFALKLLWRRNGIPPSITKAQAQFTRDLPRRSERSNKERLVKTQG